MLITIKHVDVQTQTKGKGSWQVAEVIYSDERGQTRTQKLMSFTNPQVFAAVSKAQGGDKFDVQVTKNDAGYNQWASATHSDGTSSSAPQTSQGAPAARGTTVNNYSGGRDFETKEERAIRQRLIVRQSSLSAASSVLGAGAKSPVNPDEVLALADRFTDWVFAEPNFLEDNASAG
jgi:hypothetical protein